jgi:purine nucleosidase
MAIRFIQSRWQTAIVLSLLGLIAGPATAPAAAQSQQMVIIDTDIGDDIDDALAVGLALASPELKILGITSAWGNTALRARMLDRLLCDAGRTDIPVAAGIEKHGLGQTAFTQSRWASRQPARAHPAAVDFLLEQIRQHPGEITLIGIAPLTNLGAAIERDPVTFRKLKRIVIMGGSIHRGYGDIYTPNHGPDAEYNIAMDVAAAQAVFGSGVPLTVMPLDATQHKLDEAKRQLLFTASTNLTDDLALLYLQWVEGFHQQTPVLYDDVAVAYAIDPALCPVAPMRIDADGLHASGLRAAEQFRLRQVRFRQVLQFLYAAADAAKAWRVVYEAAVARRMG